MPASPAEIAAANASEALDRARKNEDVFARLERRVSRLENIEHRPMPMDAAPRDRGILLHMRASSDADSHERFVVAHYVRWDGGRGPYAEAWETGPGQWIALHSSTIIGWSELPS